MHLFPHHDAGARAVVRSKMFSKHDSPAEGIAILIVSSWSYACLARYILSVCNGEIEEGLEGVRRCLVRMSHLYAGRALYCSVLPGNCTH